jgi:hypothetical protein
MELPAVLFYQVRASGLAGQFTCIVSGSSGHEVALRHLLRLLLRLYTHLWSEKHEER